MPPTDKTTESIQRLMDQYAEIARLAGGLAHEIKNPLSTIRLNMELLAEDLLDEPPRSSRPPSAARPSGSTWCSGSATGCRTCWTTS